MPLYGSGWLDNMYNSKIKIRLIHFYEHLNCVFIFRWPGDTKRSTGILQAGKHSKILANNRPRTAVPESKLQV